MFLWRDLVQFWCCCCTCDRNICQFHKRIDEPTSTYPLLVFWEDKWLFCACAHRFASSRMAVFVAAVAYVAHLFFNTLVASDVVDVYGFEVHRNPWTHCWFCINYLYINVLQLIRVHLLSSLSGTIILCERHSRAAACLDFSTAATRQTATGWRRCIYHRLWLWHGRGTIWLATYMEMPCSSMIWNF